MCLHKDLAENIKLSCHLNVDLRSTIKQPDNPPMLLLIQETSTLVAGVVLAGTLQLPFIKQ